MYLDWVAFAFTAMGLAIYLFYVLVRPERF
jgi:K+-transporting ATPase KdpF subunit